MIKVAIFFIIVVFIIVANGWRYEKLPIAGDSLSSYSKVEAGYNP